MSIVVKSQVVLVALQFFVFFQSTTCLPMASLSRKIAERAVAKLTTSMDAMENELRHDASKFSLSSTRRLRSRQSGFVARDQPITTSNSNPQSEPAEKIYRRFLSQNGVEPWQLISSSFQPTLKPSGTFRYSLVCKNGYLLSIDKNGNVRGGLKRNASTTFDFQVWGKGLVTIWNAWSKRYLAIKRDGSLITVKDRTIETVLIHRWLPSQYRTFKSLYYYQEGWHVGIRKNGNLKRGRPSNGKVQTAFQFVLM